MMDSNGESITGVGLQISGSEVQKSSEKVFYIVFRGAAVACDALLYLGR